MKTPRFLPNYHLVLFHGGFAEGNSGLFWIVISPSKIQQAVVFINATLIKTWVHHKYMKCSKCWKRRSSSSPDVPRYMKSNTSHRYLQHKVHNLRLYMTPNESMQLIYSDLYIPMMKIETIKWRTLWQYIHMFCVVSYQATSSHSDLINYRSFQSRIALTKIYCSGFLRLNEQIKRRILKT